MMTPPVGRAASIQSAPASSCRLRLHCVGSSDATLSAPLPILPTAPPSWRPAPPTLPNRALALPNHAPFAGFMRAGQHAKIELSIPRHGSAGFPPPERKGA